MKALLSKACVLAILAATIVSFVPIMSAQAAAPLPHIRGDNTRLYNEMTGATFKPRGANYVRLFKNVSGQTYHSTFEPGKYNAAAARAFFDQMQHDGYNTVRVFIDPGSTNANDPHGIGRGMGTYDKVYGPYMDNFASFVNEAAAHNMYVLPSLDVFPQNSYYWDIVAGTIAGVGTPNMAGRNLSYMDKGRITAKAEYMKNFADALIQRVGDNKSAVLAYQADNEVYFETNKAPYNKMSGTVTPVNGLTYDMSKPADRQQAADASLVAYSAIVKKKLLEADPNALMTMGFFTLRAVGKTSFNGFTTNVCEFNCPTNVNYWMPGRPAALSIFGQADFIDLHMYPNTTTYTPDYDLTSMEKKLFRKPFIIGEFGAKKPVYNNDIIRAAYAMRDFRVASCQQGAQGWLFWTWDTYEDLASQTLFFKMNETRGAINGQLAPIAQPDPCSTARAITVTPHYATPTAPVR